MFGVRLQAPPSGPEPRLCQPTGARRLFGLLTHRIGNMTAPIRPTQSDVAREAGVSRALVSLVVRGEPHVRPDKRAAVQEAIDRLGYRPHGAAAHLAGKRTQTIGVLVPNLVNPWFGMMITSLQTAAEGAGLHVVFSAGTAGATNARSPREDEAERAREMLSGRADALILISPRLPHEELESLGSTAPVCVIGRHLQSDRVSSVQSDPVRGGALAAEHLISRGASSLAYLAPLSPDAEEVAVHRADGFTSTARRARVPVRRQDVPIAADPEELAERMAALVRSGVDGAAVHNDQLALAVLTTPAADALRGLVGYDATPLTAFPSIALTSIDQRSDVLATGAIEAIDGLSLGRPAQHRTVAPSLRTGRT